MRLFPLLLMLMLCLPWFNSFVYITIVFLSLIMIISLSESARRLECQYHPSSIVFSENLKQERMYVWAVDIMSGDRNSKKSMYTGWRDSLQIIVQRQ